MPSVVALSAAGADRQRQACERGYAAFDCEISNTLRALENYLHSLHLSPPNLTVQWGEPQGMQRDCRWF